MHPVGDAWLMGASQCDEASPDVQRTSVNLDWIEGEKDGIRQDAAQLLAVPNAVHRFYFRPVTAPAIPTLAT
jgi:hypothetical protein